MNKLVDMKDIVRDIEKEEDSRVYLIKETARTLDLDYKEAEEYVEKYLEEVEREW